MTRLIDAEALKEEFKKRCHAAETVDELSDAVDDLEDLIDNAPTVLFPLTVTLNDKVTDEDIEVLKRLMRDYKPQVVNLEPERGEWIRLDLAKRVIAKFEGYLDDDMIARIQIALEKENEAEMKGGAE